MVLLAFAKRYICGLADGSRQLFAQKKSQTRLIQSFFYYVIILSELHKVVASTLEVILKKPPNGCRQQGQNPFVKSTGGVAYGIYFKQH